MGGGAPIIQYTLCRVDSRVRVRTIREKGGGARASRCRRTLCPRARRRGVSMTALFDEQSLAIVVVLFICTCTYIKMKAPTLLNTREGFRGILWKAARIGA